MDYELYKLNEIYKLNNYTLNEKVKWLRCKGKKPNGKTEYMSSQELAKKIGVSSSTISGLENGANCKLSTIIAVAEYFDVSIDWLCSRSTVTSSDYNVNFVCDYTGLNEKTVNALKSEHQERIKTQQMYNDLEKRLGIKNTTTLIDEILCDIILLYFEKLKHILMDYNANFDELERGIDGYIEYSKIKKKEFKQYANEVKESKGKNKLAYNKMLIEYEKIFDDIIENREMNIDAPLNSVNADLFKLQDAVISYAKSLYDISKISERAQKVKYDNSVFDYIHNLYNELSLELERGENNEKE